MKKHQADTAIAVYRELQPTLHGRQLLVRDALVAFKDEYAYWPTSSELLRFLCAQQPTRRFDPNSVRPRLFELEAQGWTAKGYKRTCTVSGKTCYTWIATTPAPPDREPTPQRLAL